MQLCGVHVLVDCVFKKIVRFVNHRWVFKTSQMSVSAEISSPLSEFKNHIFIVMVLGVVGPLILDLYVTPH